MTARKALLVLCGAGVLIAASVGRVAPADAYPPSSVPGAINPKVTQANIKTTVCVSGFTKTIRPPETYTNKLKALDLKAFSLSGAMSDYELDHYISLEIGGSPTDPRNLWPEHYSEPYGARDKDKVEDGLKAQLCAGKMTLAQVQSCITDDWIACGQKIGALPKGKQ